MPQLLPAAAAEAAMVAAPEIAATTAASTLGASGLATLPAMVSPAVGAMASGAGALGAGALEAGLATGLGTMGGLGGLATLAPGVSAAANLLGAAAPALEMAVPSLTSSLASAAPGVAGAVGEAASGLGASGLPSLAQTAGYNAAGVAPQVAQVAPTAAEVMTPAVNATNYLPQGMTEAQYASGMQNIYGPSTSTDVMGNVTNQMNTGSYAGAPTGSPVVPGQSWSKNLMNLISNPSMQGAKDYMSEHPYATAAGAYGLYNMLKGQPKMPGPNVGMIRPYTLNRTQNLAAYEPSSGTAERNYFTDSFTAGTPYKAPGPEYKAEGGIASLAVGGPVEQMSAINSISGNTMYPQSQLQTSMYSNPMVQRPMPTNVITEGLDTPVDPYTGEQKFAAGGISSLGSYSDGGRLLKGPGDGVSDSIPSVIGGRQPARLADGEFVVPARIVSELGNGSTDAGAKRLYAMMDRVQRARRKTVGKDRVAVDTRPDKYLPA